MKSRQKKFLAWDALVLVLLLAPLVYAATEAPSGFNDLTNGMVSQTQFDLDREIFDERELIEDGLGPVYNAQACAECHQNPVSGGNSQITELRVGRVDFFGNFTNR
ncbi:MAG TPA: hypothetical protein VLT87_31435, partial [Thermoanaerobaculia bacterium]|nr:hypothetical protein [Thermoanaerobaculia bacterium]